jgi:hypothetical protein
MQQNVKEKNPGIFRSEMALWIGVATALVFLAVGHCACIFSCR